MQSRGGCEGYHRARRPEKITFRLQNSFKKVPSYDHFSDFQLVATPPSEFPTVGFTARDVSAHVALELKLPRSWRRPWILRRSLVSHLTSRAHKIYNIFRKICNCTLYILTLTCIERQCEGVFEDTCILLKVHLCEISPIRRSLIRGPGRRTLCMLGASTGILQRNHKLQADVLLCSLMA